MADFGSMKVAELRAECESRGLSSKGTKAALVKLLLASTATEDEPEEAPAPKKGKKRTREEAEPAAEEETFAKQAKPTKKKTPTVDKLYHGGSATVYQDYDAMLNQTNIGGNNNKYYVIQVLQQGGRFVHWNRWGRVGENGQNKAENFGTAEAAINAFKKKFKDKTKNDWDKRANFKTAAGKYTLMELADEDEGDADVDAALAALSSAKEDVAESELDAKLQSLIQLIFDTEMFTSALQKFEIDTRKMPLGKISTTQLGRGNDVLVEIQELLKAGSKKGLSELCSQFYTLIPHDFGRRVPPVLGTLEAVQEKFDMLAVLGDIEKAQALKNAASSKKTEKKALLPNPIDVNYGKLDCDLEVVEKGSDEWKMIDKYTKETSAGGWRNVSIIDIFKVNRRSEGARFQHHNDTDNRKLLWHGTNVAVVAAILSSGLRIMPHAGGRVGRGLYFASENSKSAGYVRPAGTTGIMFLNEVVLGREHHITRDDSSLRAPPKGFDSVIAKGRTEPDPTKDTEITIDGHTVVVPQGKPLAQDSYGMSSFSQSEYLVYREDQVRIRYLLKMKFG